MTIDTNTMISITEANQNFSKVARVVDEHGTAVILKNNVPRYLVIDFSKADREKSWAIVIKKPKAKNITKNTLLFIRIQQEERPMEWAASIILPKMRLPSFTPFTLLSVPVLHRCQSCNS